MRPETISRLQSINQEFYQTFSQSFASTRNRIQPGVRKILQEIPNDEKWLDIGCGSGTLAAEWMRQERQGLYLGIDQSPNLIAQAQKAILEIQKSEDLEVKFAVVDINFPDWQKPFENTSWDGALCFAVLHHIPGADRRERLCSAIAKLLGKNKKLYVSVWQVRNSPRLVKRIQPWNLIEVDEQNLEEGDVLMDWRAENGQDKNATGLRYVHIFKPDELSSLAEKSGFRVVDSFYSDGKEGSLGLYQTWISEI
jgi:tRNA (uracil-5-)-methyltransferase TRM9